jgi:porin
LARFSLVATLGIAGGAAAEAPEPEPARTWLPTLFARNTLTGDWGGLRPALGIRGVEVGLDYTGDLMGVVAGGLKRRTSYSVLVEPRLTVDLDKLVGWTGGRLYARAIGTYGGDPAENTGSLAAPSNLASIDSFRLFEGWLEQRWFDDVLSVTFGLYAVDTEFDVKETAGVFLNGAFGTGLELSESGLNGPCIFPVSCLGLRVRVQPVPEVYVQAAALDGVAGDPTHPRGTHVRVREDDGVLVIVEAGYQRGAETGRFVRAALGGWIYTTTFDDVLDVDGNGEPRRRRGAWGLYALAESELFRETEQPTQGLSAFLRVGVADEDVNPLRYSVTAGLAYTGLVPDRDEDVAAVGVAAGIAGDKFKRAQRFAGTPVNGAEVTLEATYRIELLPWIALQLDAQYIVNPGLVRGVRDAFVLGFRHTVRF